MGKVREGQGEKKKEEILEGGKRVWKRKGVDDVGMGDMVLEGGMSEGGVQKYF